MAQKTAALPLRSSIARAWISYLNENRTVPWGDGCLDWGEPQCWACGYYADTWQVGSLKAWDKASALHRCHVIPRAMGGADDALNLVLMCARCHEDSPDHTDPTYLFQWMKSRPKRIFGTWMPDQLMDLQVMVQEALTHMTEAEVMTATTSSLEDFYSGVGTHFGNISDGTRSAAIQHLSRKLERGKTT